MSMYILFITVFIFLHISQYQSETPLCRTNCITDGQCWNDALSYRSFELIERLFSFSSLSVFVDNYQRQHPNKLNDSISFIDKALEDYLFNESIDANLTINLFNETKQILIDFCRNLTSTPVGTVDKLPSLKCSLSTCSTDTLNFMIIFIISILLTSLLLLMCVIQLFRTYHHALLLNSVSTNKTNININSNQF